MKRSDVVDRAGGETGDAASSSSAGRPAGERDLGEAAAMAGAALVFTVGLMFVTLELPGWLTDLADRWVDIPDYHPAIEPDVIDDFMATSWVRPIGYTSLGVLVVAIIAGLALERRGVAVAGAMLLFLPVFGSYAAYMFFLAGVGVLRALWLPVWGDLMALGDVAYVPYMVIVWPLWQVGIDAREAVAYGAIGIGLFVFVLSTLAWFLTRSSGRKVADVWLYRYSRHPQYLGWILWSWGVMLLAAQQPVPMAGENPGAGLPWIVSTLIIVSVAWAEEARMARQHGADYEAYRKRTPFLFPVPRLVATAATAPIRLLTGHDEPRRGTDIAVALAVFLAIALAASLPFLLLDWPAWKWWGWPGVRP